MPPLGNTFRTAEPMLHELLEQVHKGALQLPDFQRGWVWDDERIRRLIASVSLSYPIGAAMLMETGGDGVNFSPRLFEGVELSAPVKPERLVLDGQQRFTSLYRALRSGRPVVTQTDKGERIERVYYLDIERCIDPAVDRVDTVIGVPADKVIRKNFNRDIELDLRTLDLEIKRGYFPLALVFDHIGQMTWQQAYLKHHQYAQPVIDRWNQFQSEVWLRFQQYKVPVIELMRGTDKEAVCQVFENVNTGGVALTVFELVTAMYAADDFRLREDWTARHKRLAKHAQLKKLGETEFLQAVTLLATWRRHQSGGAAVGCKRKDILKLPLADYQKYAPAIEEGMVKAARLLTREKVYDARNLPYSTQLVPLAAICAAIGSDFEDDAVRQKLARWYWCGVFGELYGGATEARFALDIQHVTQWVKGGGDPRTVLDANFAPTRLLTLQTRQSAAYKGLMAKLMQVGSEDFQSGDPIELTTFFDERVDIHHIFPVDWCEKAKLPQERWNSVVNKAPLTARTNRSLGGRAPSTYVQAIDKKLGAKRVNELLVTHLIEPALLRSDSFDAFIRDRATRLLDLIEKATGRTVSGRDSDEVKKAFGAALVKAS